MEALYRRRSVAVIPLQSPSLKEMNSHSRLATSSQPTPPINAAVFAATTVKWSACRFGWLHPDPPSSAKFGRVRGKRSSNFPLMRGDRKPSHTILSHMKLAIALEQPHLLIPFESGVIPYRMV